MKIGIDIDDTVTETKEIFHKYLKKYRKKYHLKKNQDQETLSYEEYQKFLNEFGFSIYCQVKEKKNASKIIRKWYDKGYEIYFVTARNKKDCMEVEEYTKTFFKEHRIPYHKIFYGIENKYHCLKEYNIDLFIDDREKILDDFPKNKIVLLKMVPNKNNYSKYQKVSSWKEIETIVDKMN